MIRFPTIHYWWFHLMLCFHIPFPVKLNHNIYADVGSITRATPAYYLLHTRWFNRFLCIQKLFGIYTSRIKYKLLTVCDTSVISFKHTHSAPWHFTLEHLMHTSMTFMFTVWAFIFWFYRIRMVNLCLLEAVYFVITDILWKHYIH